MTTAGERGVSGDTTTLEDLSAIAKLAAAKGTDEE
jgi:hypothetical protein